MQLEFSKKYSRDHSQNYFEKHQNSLMRVLSNKREASMLRKSLKLSGQPKSVLDIPSGTGRFWELLSEQPGREIIAADNSIEMIQTGIERRPSWVTGRVRFVQCSAFCIPLVSNSVENVFSIRFFHHLGDRTDRIAALREMRRVASNSICISLWLDGNFKSLRRSIRGRGQAVAGYQNRFVFSKKEILEEFREVGLRPVARVDFLKFYSMWTTYVLKRNSCE